MPRRMACSPSTISGCSAKYRFTWMAADETLSVSSVSSSAAAFSTEARSIQAAPAGASPSRRRWNTSRSITTSVPALARMLPSGRRTAP
ncbi:MAG TPA: hypothetical protein VJK90_12335, partial [Acetobacteraceae bacterium]|nr:hypothetical protein [Acetobacteraceae bacterium]